MAADRIITGFDGSAPGRAAAHWAAREAVREGLPLDVLRAGSREPRRGREEPAAEAEADGLRARFPGLEVRVVHAPEDPVVALAAASERAALLVLGSRGLGSLRGFLTGSVSQRVLGAAHCPVVLVRARAGTRSEEPAREPVREPVREPRGVTAGLDLAHPCDPVLDFAFRTTARRREPLTVVHAWGPPAGTEYLHFGSIGGQEKQQAADARRALDEALAPWREHHPEVPVSTEVLMGHAGITLVDAAAGTGLLVIGARRHRNPVGAHLGPVAHAVIHHAPCPLAVVPLH
ncbi:universal stress protein [Kitasatospora sp. NPDC097605]|uniref:universal stress protein n=1 Tax=Kitasatospora sp. NPDC097605 TaxID=3157226 RepID=UPI0033316034